MASATSSSRPSWRRVDAASAAGTLDQLQHRRVVVAAEAGAARRLEEIASEPRGARLDAALGGKLERQIHVLDGVVGRERILGKYSGQERVAPMRADRKTV